MKKFFIKICIMKWVMKYLAVTLLMEKNMGSSGVSFREIIMTACKRSSVTESLGLFLGNT